MPLNIPRTTLGALLCLAFLTTEAQQLVPYAPTCEYREAPQIVDAETPRLSWKLEATDPEARGLTQTGYQILAASTPELLAADEGDLWDTGKVGSSDSALIPWSGAPLVSGQDVYWKVRVWDDADAASDWLESHFRMGLLEPSDWEGQWIGSSQEFVQEAGWPTPDNTVPNPVLRKTFDVAELPARATLYIASMGYHDFRLNGMAPEEIILAPNNSYLTERVLYCAYDVADLVQEGTNELRIALGAGWSIFSTYETENRPIVLAQLSMQLANGNEAIVVTDSSWEVRDSERTTTGAWEFRHMGGEKIDFGVPPAFGPDDTGAVWNSVVTFTPDVIVSADMAEPNIISDAFHAVAIKTYGSSTIRVDMGLQYTGWLEVDLQTEPETPVSLQFSEFNRFRSGTVNGQTFYESYYQHSSVEPADETAVSFSNLFNYASYRWVTLGGWSEMPQLEDFTALPIRNGTPIVGSFASSNLFMDTIYNTALWTLENLTLGGVIVDCAHRERMGYGGDAHATMDPTLMNYGAGALYTKWMQDWRDVQNADGSLPNTAPTVWGGGGTAWGGFVVTLPWQAYLTYGDVGILADNYDMMTRYTTWLEGWVQDGVLQKYAGRFGFLGDWVPPGGVDPEANTPEAAFFNNAYFVYMLDLLSQIATVLGEDVDAIYYADLADDMRPAIHAEFFNESDHSYVNGRQAYMALAVVAGIAPEELQEDVAAQFLYEVETVQEGHIDAGITGHYFVLKALEQLHRDDLIFEMADKRTYPGWGHMLENGATTFWESWDALVEDDSMMHSSYLSIGAWFNYGPGGINPVPEAPGFKMVSIEPEIVGDLTWANCSFDSIRGPIQSSWRLEPNRLIMDIEIPANSSGRVRLPVASLDGVQESGAALSANATIQDLGADPEVEAWWVQVPSGRYSFQMPFDTTGRVISPFNAYALEGRNRVTPLGLVNDDYYPFVWHEDQGWWKVFADSADSIWAFDYASNEWFWTSANFYPFLYRYDSGNWLLYLLKNYEGRWFYDYSTRDTVVLPL